jgi:biopolymer transport protein ExbB
MNVEYLIHLANYSDGVLYALAFLLLLELAVILDRFWYLRRTLLGGSRVVHQVARHGALGHGELEMLRRGAGRLPEAVIIDAAARHFEKAHGEALGNRIDEAIMLMAPQLDRRVWVLDTVITLGPLLGLFGTILGIFHAFGVLSKPGSSPTAVTGGVADALIATAAGIFVAMLGLLAYNGLNTQIRTILHQLDSLKLMLLNRLDGAPVVPVASERVRAPVAATMTAAAGVR